MAELNTQFPTWMLQKQWHDRESAARTGNQALQAIQLGSQAAARNRELALREQAARLELEAQQHIENGTVELGELMAEGGRNSSYTDPAWQGKFWSTAKKYPQLHGTQSFMGLVGVIENAKKAEQSWSETQARLGIEKTPADVVKLQYLAVFEDKIAQAEAAGDTATANQIRKSATLLEGTMLAPQETFETFTDDQGKDRFRIVRGGPAAKPTGGLTVATQTEIQKRQLGYTKSMGMAKTLLNVLKPQNVGVLGAGQQIIVDEGLAQVIPELASQQNVDARTLLRVFNETMLKTLKADSQLNQKEEQRILAALPKTGANESFPGAVAKIVRALTELHSMAATDAKTAGLPEPAFPLDPQTLRELVMTKKLDADIGVSLLQKYYPNFQLKP